MPKHSFICCLAAYKRLLIKDRLKHMGISQDNLCVIYGNEEETIEHLFFKCQLSKECLGDIMRWLNIGVTNIDFRGLDRRMTRQVKGKMCRAFVLASLAVVDYYIWKERNVALWE
ncbi:uncharacterized protein LOC142171918 [Nicotiana tabacum]|uniref:Uncharacterized protein LOC142171918 n=1 Tax=Nicotiana tabacum TaxID=4097 RepID=A0AC58T3D1_TOBAC